MATLKKQNMDPGRGVLVVIAGLVVIFSSFAVALVEYSQAADVSTAMAPITGVVGAIVGAYFGVNVGAAGKDKADQHRKEADDDAKKLAAAIPHDQLKDLDLNLSFMR
jgi:phage tail tape-measure protein